MLGIIQEQHPDRCRLFMQWKQMDWPVLVDSLNLLGLSVVPLTMLIDEEGIVRSTRARQSDLEAFLARPAPDSVEPGTPAVPSRKAMEAASSQGAEQLVELADWLVRWGSEPDLNAAVEAYRKALESISDDGRVHFRLGVALRKRYDSSLRRTDDFSKAVHHWGRALEIDPNQYIWRRRIQQYGPRLDKPYPFYDWVVTARREVEERGEKPWPLVVEPGGAEFAGRARDFQAAPEAVSEPDPRGRIRRDEGFVEIETIVVPERAAPGKAVRVHVVMRPNLQRKAHWNNEAEDLVFWLDPPPGWQADARRLSLPRPEELVSDEERRIEFELKAPDDFSGTAEVGGYALYYVCEDLDGACLFRRGDVSFVVKSAEKREGGR